MSTPLTFLAAVPPPSAGTFLDARTSVDSWSRVEPLFDQLERHSLESATKLQAWLVFCSELQAAIDEELSLRYIASTRDTASDALDQAYLDYIETVTEPAKERWHRLHLRYLASTGRGDLEPRRYAVLDRIIENEAALFVADNLALETAEARHSRRYQRLMGNMTVDFDGQQRTLPEMRPYLEELDRSRRKAAWQAVEQRRFQDKDELEDVFHELVLLRGQMASNCGFASYRDYMFRRLRRFDYGPRDCEQLHATTERFAMPSVRMVQQQLADQLGVSVLRPWDLLADPDGESPLSPFTSTEALREGCQTIFERVFSAFGEQFCELSRYGLLDLASRVGKAPGAYQITLARRRLPFIFMSSAGGHEDVVALLHEGGHAFHCCLTRHEPLLVYRDVPTEIAEVASMAMELLGARHLEVFYSQHDAERARRRQLRGIIPFFAWAATIDAFQHAIYTATERSKAARRNTWAHLRARYAGLVDHHGLEELQQVEWLQQSHLFETPFYYVEYVIAQLGALQVWQRSLADPLGAVNAYRKALGLGGSRPLPELFAAAGATLDFSGNVMLPLLRLIHSHLTPAPR
ncbi:MAG: M3 family oligoendopeptidase [Candidatus Schekmanbacteria bacterium]|nr:M3 family oligoendopeptidase [Candidatus Schekmanbacteria bacterium]